MLLIVPTTLICLLLAWWGLLYTMQTRMMFPADMAPRPAAHLPANVAVLKLDIDGGRVEAWFHPAPDASPEHPAPVVMLFHGNAEIIDEQDDAVGFYRGLGCSVLLPEFRGYGRSAGQPSQAAIRADALRFYDMMIQRPDVDRARIAFFGCSVGDRH